MDSTSVCALRLQEAGVIEGTPPKLLAQGPNRRLLNELKRELKNEQRDCAASYLTMGCDQMEFDT